MKTVLVGAVSVVAALALAMVLFGQSGTTAEAKVNGIVPSATSADAGDPITLNVDADELATNSDVTVVATAGAFTAGLCDNAIGDTTAAAPCAIEAGSTPFGATTSSTIIDGDAANPAGGTDNISLTFVCPTPGPAAPVISAIQGTSVGTVNLICRGNVAEIKLETRMQTAPGVITTQNVTNIESTSATSVAAGSRAIAANLRTTASDSAGNKLGDVTVIYITTDGSLVTTASAGSATEVPLGFDTTSTAAATLGVANAVSLVHGTTGVTGDVATITANAVGKTATADVTFAGNATSCTVSSSETSVGSGGSTTITANFFSDAGQTVGLPDYSTIAGTGTASGDPTITAVNAVGTGTFAVTGLTAPIAGTMNATLTVGASGGTGVLATMGGSSVTCNTTVSVSTTVEPPSGGGTGGTGDGAINGTLPTSGFGLVTFGGTIDELKTALATACPSGAPIFATSGGAFVGFFSTTTLEAPNAAFVALYGASGLPANTPLLGGNC